MSWWGTIFSSAMGQAFREAHELDTGARLARRLGSSATVELAPGSIELRHVDDGWVAQLGMQQLGDEQWERLLRSAAADPPLMASIVTGELPIEFHSRAVEEGCSLAPQRSEVSADCTCPDWHDPCRHVGALVTLAAELIDQDPWLLAMLRGRSRDQVVEAVRRRRSEQRGIEWVEQGDEPRGPDAGVAAAAALRSTPAALPTALPPLRRPAGPVDVQAPPADAGLGEADLRRLAGDAAERAHALLSGDEDADALALDVSTDVARIAAGLDDDEAGWELLAERTGESVDQLRRRADEWIARRPNS